MKLCWATLTSFNKDNRVNIFVKKQSTMKFSVVYIFWEYAKKNFELNLVLLVVLVLESKCFYERRLLLLTSSLTLKVMVFFTGDSHLRKVDREIYSTWKCPNVRISTLLFDSLPYLKRYFFSPNVPCCKENLQPGSVKLVEMLIWTTWVNDSMWHCISNISIGYVG